jgi:hypothetical protein
MKTRIANFGVADTTLAKKRSDDRIAAGRSECAPGNRADQRPSKHGVCSCRGQPAQALPVGAATDVTYSQLPLPDVPKSLCWQRACCRQASILHPI